MTWRRGEAGSTLIDRPNDDPVPDFHECQGKGYERGRYVAYNRDVRYSSCQTVETLTARYQATASQGTSVASCGDSSYMYLLDDNNDYTKLLVYQPHNDV